MPDFKYRFTCGDSDLSEIIKKCQTLIDSFNLSNLIRNGFASKVFYEMLYGFSSNKILSKSKSSILIMSSK